jgi:sugar phosphate isomerase/epimerase
MHQRLSLSQASSLNWSLEQDLALYTGLGVRKVGVLLRKLEAAGIEYGIDLIQRSGIDVDNMAIGPCLDLTTPHQWPQGREKLAEAVALAKRLGCPCVVITTGPAGSLRWEEAADAFEAAIVPARQAAEREGVSLAVENTNGLRFDLGFLHTFRDTLYVAERTGLTICLEVSDFVVGTTRTPDRAVPGDGTIPLERILSQLLVAGYAGPFELEILGPRIEAEGYEAAIRRSLALLSPLLDRLETDRRRRRPAISPLV